ncbi:hypothetical protein [Maritalea sp.]|uniref:hypothetical protein n=1 Tax=Maritalea sp. TaxID=2003361 RepID=UPI0039E2B08D
MTKNLVLGLILLAVLSGCARNPQTDLAIRKFLVGYDGLSCSEAYQEYLNDGETQEMADANYEICIAEKS